MVYIFNIFLCIISFVVFYTTPVSYAALLKSYTTVKIIILNKQEGSVNEYVLPISQVQNFNTLNIIVDGCVFDYTHDTFSAKLQISLKDDTTKTPFIGWFFSSYPSDTKFENNQYTIRLIDCYNVQEND